MNEATLQVSERRLWFAIAGRGLAAAIAATFLFANPWRSIGGTAVVLAAYAVADGASSLYASIRTKKSGAGRQARLSAGGIVFVDLAAAALAIAMPTLVALRLIGALRAITTGALDALQFNRRGASELLSVRGVVAIGLGVLIVAWPGPGSVALPWLLGFEAMVSAGLLFTGGVSELNRAHETETEHHAMP